VFEQFADGVMRLQAYGGLPSFEQSADLWQGLWHMEVHHSTAVEGNTLVLREVEALLQQGRAVGAKDLKDYMEVLGYGEASRWVFDQAGVARTYQHNDLITLTELRHLHEMAMGPVWQVAPHPLAQPDETPGGFRTHEIAAFPRGMKPPSFPLVSSLVNTWITEVNRLGEDVASGRVDLVAAPVQLARVHVGFERIHPFLDGNGRAGRLALNLILVRLGWAPVVILKTQRQRYLDALMKADDGKFDRLAELLARASIASLYRLIPKLAASSDLVPLAVLADKSLSIAALRQAVARGRLRAVLDAKGSWLSSREDVDTYLKSRQRG